MRISHVELSLSKMTSEVQIALNLVTGEQEHGKLITVDCRAFGRKNTIFLSHMKVSFNYVALPEKHY